MNSDSKSPKKTSYVTLYLEVQAEAERLRKENERLTEENKHLQEKVYDLTQEIFELRRHLESNQLDCTFKDSGSVPMQGWQTD